MQHRSHAEGEKPAKEAKLPETETCLLTVFFGGQSHFCGSLQLMLQTCWFGFDYSSFQPPKKQVDELGCALLHMKTPIKREEVWVCAHAFASTHYT